MHGLDPHAGARLTAKPIDGRIPGWDITGSVSKAPPRRGSGGDRHIGQALWGRGS
jgi:hypothetical protein